MNALLLLGTIAMLLGGCETIKLDKPGSANVAIDYLPWRDNALALRSGMRLETIATSQGPIGTTKSTPIIAEQVWILPEPGQAARLDWARFNALLIASRLNGPVPVVAPLTPGAPKPPLVNVSELLDRIAASVGNQPDFGATFTRQVIDRSVASMRIVYVKEGSADASDAQHQDAAWIKAKLCSATAKDFNDFRQTTTPAQAAALYYQLWLPSRTKSDPEGSLEFSAFDNDDWFFRSNVAPGQTANDIPNEWFDGKVPANGARQSVGASIAVKLVPGGATSGGAREYAAPCLSVADVEARTGATVLGIRRLSGLLPIGIPGTPDAAKLKGKDGRFALVFGGANLRLGAKAELRADPAFKQQLLVAHGDVIYLDREPTDIFENLN